jgi:hypothetical protein
MFTLTEAKGNFFDRQAVIDAVGRERAGIMARAGALVRTIARRSMRHRRASSRPPAPPSSHAGQLRDLLFFGYDAATENTLVGPVRIDAGIVPHLLEFGGEERVTDRRSDTRTARYAGNPFMAPALLAAAPSFPSMWANSIKG